MRSSGEHVSGELRGSGGLGGYVGGWRVSLRLAARDLRAHKGRAVLVALLIGLPLFLVAAGGTAIYTQEVSPREGITRTMGSAQALLTEHGSVAIVQDTSGRTFGELDGSQKSNALHFPGSPKSPTSKDVQGVTGGSLHPIGYSRPYVVLPDKSVLATTLGIDGRQQVYDGMAKLTSGRWPRTPDEVLVSRAGAARGIPTRGTLTLHESDGAKRTHTVRIVGRADTPDGQELVALPSGQTSSWLLQRKTPVRWPEVKQLNRYGIQVQSGAVIDNPSQAKLDPAEIIYEPTGAPPVSLLVLLGTGLVVVIALLAGPAFAAGGARHRRALGQLASNGASKSQLRRYVLAQALLLGALSAVLAIGLGAVVGGVAPAVYNQWWSPTTTTPGPVDLRWGWGLILLAVAVFASLVAAFVPAVAASRVSLIAVLRGHVSVAKVHVGWPILGVLLVAGGGVVLFAALVGSEGDEGGPSNTGAPIVAGIIAGAVALFAGALMTAPWLLARLGNLARFFPVPLRVAARDVGRQRGRAVATAGAILATVAVLTTASIALASNNRAMEEAYEPSLPMGQALVASNDQGALSPRAVSVVHDQLPNASLTELRSVGAPNTGTTGGMVPVTVGYQSACSPTKAMVTAADDSSCHVAFADAAGSSLLVATPNQLATAFRLSVADVAALRAGRILVPTRVAHPSRPLTVVTGTGRQTDTGSLRDVRVTGRTSVPVAASRQPYFAFVPPRPESGGMTSSYGSPLNPAALMSTEAARKLPVRSFLAGILIRNPGGVSTSTEQTIGDRLNDPVNGTFDHLYVERGYQNTDAWIWAVIATVFGLLVLVATLTSTALSNAESRADSATFASLGAPARLRRLIAGSNAAVVGLFGALLGLVVGGIAGYAASHPATQTALGSGHRTITVVPWTMLLAVAIGVPLLAAALAALATRGRVPMTRRLT